METRAGDPGAFARFDLSRVDTPAFVIDAARLRANLDVLAEIGARSGAKVLSALKAFSMWSVADLVSARLDGVCASGLFEARLGRAHYGGHISTYGPAYKAEELEELVGLSDHLIFNSPAQIARAGAAIGHVSVGLRINPLHAEGDVPRYDPCAPCSRLGFPIDQLRGEHLEAVNGIHMHTLCEQDFAPLARTWAAVEPSIAPHFGQLDWINLGGGHHITRADYQRDELVEFLIGLRERSGCQLFLEPGEAVALDAGILVGTLLDTQWNGMALGIADVSATCHMPDVIEAPYRPAMLGERSDGDAIRLGGPSCLAGDVIGDYRLPVAAEPGARFAFLDQGHYSMVKTNSFNGVPLPSIWLWDSESDALRCVKRFGYEDFLGRLS